MSNYIWEELKRVIIKKKISIIVVLMITTAFGLYNISKLNTLEVQLRQDYMLLNTQKIIRDKAETLEFQKAAFSRDIISTEKQIADEEQQLNTINNYDKSKLDEQIQNLEKEHDPKNEYKISQLKYERKYNIEKYELMPKGIYASMELMAFIPALYLLILIIFLSDIVAGEYAPNTIKLLITKPISRKIIILSKFIVSIILSASTIVISSLIFVVEAGIHLGFSDYRAPFDVGAKYFLDKSLPLSLQMMYVSGSRTIIPVWSSNVELVLITIIFSIAITSIIIFISTVCKSSLISALTNFILIGGITIWYFAVFMGNYHLSAKYGVFLKYLPIPYMINSLEVLTGYISVRLTSSINVFFVSIVCLGWMLIMMSLSTYIFAKRDFD